MCGQSLKTPWPLHTAAPNFTFRTSALRLTLSVLRPILQEIAIMLVNDIHQFGQCRNRNLSSSIRGQFSPVSIIVPMLHTHRSLNTIIRRTSGRSQGTSKQSNALSDIGWHRTGKHSDNSTQAARRLVTI